MAEGAGEIAGSGGMKEVDGPDGRGGMYDDDDDDDDEDDEIGAVDAAEDPENLDAWEPCPNSGTNEVDEEADDDDDPMLKVFCSSASESNMEATEALEKSAEISGTEDEDALEAPFVGEYTPSGPLLYISNDVFTGAEEEGGVGNADEVEEAAMEGNCG
jgi:hypothetical protein